MIVLIFDMDGVLLQPGGYHRALTETVRLVSRAMGFEEFTLTEEDIARFEALGVSSEWHSSALCAAMMVIEMQTQGVVPKLSPWLNLPEADGGYPSPDLAALYARIAEQPLEHPPLQRAQTAIRWIANRAGVDPAPAASLVAHCKDPDRSLTFNLFQELVLGTERYARIYSRPPQLNCSSYLEIFDRPLLSMETRERIFSWLKNGEHRAAVMTNRPSSTLLGNSALPDAGIGMALVGLDGIPLIGSGDLVWLARYSGKARETLLKPSACHALAALYAALGMDNAQALMQADRTLTSGGLPPDAGTLEGAAVYVFEDTPAGMLSVESACRILRQLGISLQVHKAGIAQDPLRSRALRSQGATVFASVNQALAFCCK